MDDLYGQANEVAREHCQYAAAMGQTPAQVIRSVGERVHPTLLPDWHDAQALVGRAWLTLMRRR